MSVPRITGLAIAALGIAMGFVGGAAEPSLAAVAKGPVWSLRATSVPSSLVRLGAGKPGEEEQRIVVVATNVGDGPTSGPVTMTDRLPQGIEPDPFRETLFYNRIVNAKGSFPIPCTVGEQEGNKVITCEASEAVVAGESMRMEIPVVVTDKQAGPTEVSNVMNVSGGAAESRTESVPIEIEEEAEPGFVKGSEGAKVEVFGSGGERVDDAGAHPYQEAFGFAFNSFFAGPANVLTVAEPKTVNVTLPRGMYADPLATAVKCTEAQLESDKTIVKGIVPGGCPRGSQVGVATAEIYTASQILALSQPIFNMVSPPGSAATLGFDAEAGIYVHIFGHVLSNGEYEVAADTPDIPGKVQVLSVYVNLWGDPTDEAHDPMRGLAGELGSEPGTGGCIGRSEEENKCPTERLGTSFLTLPSDCPANPLTLTAETTGWQEPESVDQRRVGITDLDGGPISILDCAAIGFTPSIASHATNDRADSPSGLEFNLHQPQDTSYEGRATANLKDVEVTLPNGVAVNPSSAHGLGICTEGQMGYQPQGGKLRFSEEAQTCPNSAKIGTVEVTTPVLDHVLPGSIYVAKPYDNPFGSLLAIYLAVEDEQSGVISKLAGKVSPNPLTGQLTATFAENPELPIEDIKTDFFGGEGASLKTGLTCGSYTTTSSLVPWSTPEGATAHPSDTFTTNVAASGSGSCPTSEGGAPFAPRFMAGTVTPTAGSHSPLTLSLARADGEQHITGIDTTLPVGLIGKPAGIPYCSEAQIAAARSREVPQQGTAEQASPSCPASTEVGTVTVGAGAGQAPYFVEGHAYWAGPYKGAPLSLVVIAPAVAGPFDLGSVVTRVALYVEEFSAQVHAVSDPLPTILDGIPLDLRSIMLNLNRPNFVLNPTSCREKQITGNLGSQAGASHPLLNRFQAVGCNKLGFKPTLKLSLSGATKRTGHPALKAVVTYPSKGAYANIARAQVSLPHSEFLDQGNLNKVCTRPQLKSQTCPKSSIYGRVKAWTPLLDKPLEGPVYLGVGFGDKLPDIVAELNGQIRVLLKGKVDTDAENGIRNTFESVPDAPASRVEFKLKGGKKYGLLENSENICRHKQQALTRFSAQNGIVNVATVPIGNSCGSKKKHAKKTHP